MASSCIRKSIVVHCGLSSFRNMSKHMALVLVLENHSSGMFLFVITGCRGRVSRAFWIRHTFIIYCYGYPFRRGNVLSPFWAHNHVLTTSGDKKTNHGRLFFVGPNGNWCRHILRITASYSLRPRSSRASVLTRHLTEFNATNSLDCIFCRYER
jgi:hypothetical protein